MESPAFTTTSWNVWTDKNIAPAQPETISQAIEQAAEIDPSAQPETTDQQQAARGIGRAVMSHTLSTETTQPFTIIRDGKTRRADTLEDLIVGKIKRANTLEDVLTGEQPIVSLKQETAQDDNNDDKMTLQETMGGEPSAPNRRGRRAYAGKHWEKTNLSTRKRRVAVAAAATIAIGLFGGLSTSGHNPDRGATETIAIGDNGVGDQRKPNTVIVTKGGEPIMGVSPRQEKIIDNIPGLSEAERKTLERFTTGVHKVAKDLDGVNPNVMLAQAVHESSFGKTGSARADHNLFGMKGEYKGKSGTWMTWEEVKGKAKRMPAKFKKYPSEAESMKDYIDQAHRLKVHYGDAITAPEGKPYRDDGDYLDHILDRNQPNEAAYATDSKYKGKILSTIKRLFVPELTKIDKTPVEHVEVSLIPKPVAADPTAPKVPKITGIKNMIKKYALFNYRPKGTRGAMDKTDAYNKAILAAELRGEYIGGYDGVDCGAFVQRVMRDSGADPNYNPRGGNTYEQKKYLETYDDVNTDPGVKPVYHQVKSDEKLKPGDIAIKSNGQGTVGHTFFYVGNSLDTKDKDFKGVLASASLGGRAPMASNDYRRSAYKWFRVLDTPAAK